MDSPVLQYTIYIWKYKQEIVPTYLDLNIISFLFFFQNKQIQQTRQHACLPLQSSTIGGHGRIQLTRYRIIIIPTTPYLQTIRYPILYLSFHDRKFNVSVNSDSQKLQIYIKFNPTPNDVNDINTFTTFEGDDFTRPYNIADPEDATKLIQTRLVFFYARRLNATLKLY